MKTSILGKVSCVFMAVILTPAVLFAATPHSIHLSWDEMNGCDTTMVISWDTGGTNDATQVQYGKTTGYELGTVNGSSFDSAATGDWQHSTKLTGLDPETLYYYRCGSAAGWSSQSSFTTGPVEGDMTHSFVFAANGDSRTNDAPRTTIAGLTAARNPEFLLFGGDFVNSGTTMADWDASFASYADLFDEAPFMMCDANHENGVAQLWDQVVFPNNEKWYSFNYGNVHYIALQLQDESYTESNFSTTQYNWLAADLAAADADPNILYKIVTYHCPLYEHCGNHPSNTAIRAYICPLFDQYKVDICFQAHNHIYGRSNKVYNGSVVETGPDFDGEVDGTLYITTGGAGAPLSSTEYNAWTAYSTAQYSYCILDINNSTYELTGTTRNIDDNVIDTFKIIKTPPLPTKVVVSAGAAEITADGSDSAVITATLCTDADVPVVAATNTVLFSKSGEGTLVGATSKAAVAGIATISLQSTTTLGTATVTATSTGLDEGSVNVVTTVGPAAKLISTAADASIDANGSSTTLITAQAYDAQDHIHTDSFGDSVGWTGFSGGGTWMYRKELTIDSSSALTDYQVEVTLSEVGAAGLVSAGKMQADYDDVRFTLSDGSTEINHWVGTDSFIAKVPSIANGTTTIYMYYGNASVAGASDGANTFDFFADFEGCANGNDGACEGISGLSGTWTVVDGKYYQCASAMNILAEVDALSMSEYSVQLRGRILSGTGNSVRLAFGIVDTNNYWVWMIDGNVLMLRQVSGGSEINAWSTATSWSTGTWYDLKVQVEGSNIDCYFDGDLKYQHTGGSALTGSVGVGAHNTQGDFDDIRVGKYAASAPTISAGSEEENIASAPVTFSVSGPGTLLGSTSPGEVNGAATVILRANTSAGTVTVTSTADGLDQDTVDVELTAVGPHIECNANPASIRADGSDTTLVTAGIYDGLGVFQDTATDTITFSISGQGSLLGATVKAASAGLATVEMQSNTTVGTSLVIATADALYQGYVQVDTTPNPVKIICTADVTTIGVGGSSAFITAEICDSGNNLVNTTTNNITFGVVGEGSFVGGSVKAASNGIATVEFQSGTLAGTMTVTATSQEGSGLSSGNVNIETIPGPGTKLVNAANPGSIDADGTSTSLITAQASDQYDNPVTTLSGGEDEPFSWEDTFTGGKGQSWTELSGTWSVVADKYQEATDTVGFYAWSYGGESTWTDYSVEVDLSAGDSKGRFFVCGRWQDADNHYELEVSDNGMNLNVVSGGSRSALDTSATVPSIPTTAKLVMNGTSLEGWVGGIQYLTATDTAFSQGCIALGETERQAIFDNVLVSGTGPGGVSVGWGGLSNGSGNWMYRKPITVNSSAALSDYQVKLAFTAAGVAGLISGGKMQANCQDVRFTLDDESTEVSYWLDSTFSDAKYFWLNIPSVANGSTVLYMYYGNPAANAVSDGDSTFELFDDFEGTTLDTGKWQTWQVGTGTKNMSVSGGSLNLSAQGSEWTCSGIYTQSTSNYSSLIIEVKNKWDMSATEDTNKEVRVTDAIPALQDSGDQYRFDYYHSATQDKYRLVKNVSDVGSEQVSVALVNVNPTNYEWERYVLYSGNQLAYRSTDGINYSSLWSTNENTILTLPDDLYIGYSVSEGYNVGAASAQLDWLRVRQYASSEPSTALGSEQQNMADAGITFSVSGPGILLGETAPEAVAGMATVIMQSTGAEGTITVNSTADSLTQGSVNVEAGGVLDAVRIVATAGDSSILADGSDTTMIYARIYNAGTTFQAGATNTIIFNVSGAGSLVNPTSKAAVSGLATIVLQSTTSTGTATVTATSAEGDGLDQGSVQVITMPRQVKIITTADRTSIAANGTATALVTASVCDAGDALVNTAIDTITFSISGDGTLLAATQKSAVAGKATIMMQSIDSQPGLASVTATATGLTRDSVNITTDPKVVEPPTGLAITAKTEHTLTLGWSAGAGNVKYLVEKSENGADYTELSANLAALTITDTELKAGTTYYYKVYGIDSEDDSSSSAGIAGRTNAVTVISIADGGKVGTAGDIEVDIEGDTFTQEAYIDINTASEDGIVDNSVVKLEETVRDITAKTLFGTDINTFGKDVELKMYYTDDDLNGVLESSLRIYWLDSTNNRWVKVGGTVDTDNRCVTAMLSHFSMYCVMGESEDAELSIQNVASYPNPMNDETVFTFEINRSASVKLDVYTVAGKLVKSYDAVAKDAGYNEIPAGSSWDGTDDGNEALASGLYLYKLTAVPDEEGARTKTATGKLVIMR